MLQSLTKAALDEEEAERTAAVQEVVTALRGNVESESLQSLRSEVDDLVEDLRLEVVAGAEQGLEVEQVVRLCPLTTFSVLFGPVLLRPVLTRPCFCTSSMALPIVLCCTQFCHLPCSSAVLTLCCGTTFAANFSQGGQQCSQLGCLCKLIL